LNLVAIQRSFTGEFVLLKQANDGGIGQNASGLMHYFRSQMVSRKPCGDSRAADKQYGTPIWKEPKTAKPEPPNFYLSA
jgi:hypothetical protein